VENAKVQRRSGSIQVLARAAAIFKALDSNRDGLTISELASATRLPRPTVQRIVMSLRHDGLLCNTGRGKRFGIGPEFLRLALSVHIDLATVAQPVMDELSSQVEESVNLLVQNGRRAVCIAHSCFLQDLQITPRLGSELPLHGSAAGKAILAAMTDEAARKLLGSGRWEKCTSRTRTVWTDLVDDLDHVRVTGIAVDIEEHMSDIAALAVPVSTICGKLHALAVPIPVQRLQQKRPGIERALRKAKRALDELIRRHQI
jgi:DNA-binding IclR family transcriptional regulator